MVRDGKGALVDGCLLHCGAQSLRGGKSNFGGAVLQDVTVVEVRKTFWRPSVAAPACEDRRFVTCTIKQYWEP